MRDLSKPLLQLNRQPDEVREWLRALNASEVGRRGQLEQLSRELAALRVAERGERRVARIKAELTLITTLSVPGWLSAGRPTHPARRAAAAACAR